MLGFPTTSRVADRYRLTVDTVGEALLDFEATGWVRHLSFAGSSGWSLTDAGRAENERRLADELDLAAARYTDALRKVDTGQRAWVDAHDRDSCHLLWIQFHEDLLATLGIPRGFDT